VTKREKEPLELSRIFSPFDRSLAVLRARLFGRFRVVTVSASVVLYAAAAIAFGSSFGVSTNFFVLIPVLFVSIGYGLAAGLAAGALALPANLAIFAALGRPEYSPASKPLAELAGLVVGTVVGYLSDYHKKLETERALRKETEGELRRALRDRETLFREVHHRVKNNLNLVKSIIGLQARRSGDPAFKDAAAALTGRIMSISFVHERLYRTAELSAVAIDEYLKDLVNAVAMAVSASRNPVTLEFDLARVSVSMDVAVPLGLIVNELVTNALKHGRASDEPLSIRVSLHPYQDGLRLSASDDGDGFEGLAEGVRLPIEDAAVMHSGRLGLTLLDLMSSQLGGEGYFERAGGRTEFCLSFADKR